jgi:predicted nucleic acid-binding protein
MLGIDTNVVMRLLVSDDAEQTRRARKLIEQSLGREEPVLVSLLVLIESEWVLRSSYGFKRDAVLGMFRALLEAREVVLPAYTRRSPQRDTLFALLAAPKPPPSASMSRMEMSASSLSSSAVR